MFKFLIHNLIVIIFLLFPVGVFANVVITEVMYDVSGSDAGLEWVEIENSGLSSVTVADYHFWEADVHHGLSPDGFSELGPGDTAVIVQNIDSFESYYGVSSVKLIKSSFSLINAGGEELGVSDEDKNLIFTVTYDTDAGAAGNGKSLHYGSGGWYESHPTPGGASVSVPESETTSGNSSSHSSSSTSGTSSNTSKTKSEKKPREFYTAYINHGSVMFSQSELDIEAYVVHTRNNKDSKKLGGFYYLSFGDGHAIESKQRIETQHIYRHPGTYTLVFEYYTSRLAFDAGEDPKVLLKKDIEIHECSEISIADVDFLGNVQLHNGTNHKVDLFKWNIANEDSHYTFPRHTYIHPDETLTIDASIHNLLPFTADTWFTLRNNRDYSIHSFSINKKKNKKPVTAGAAPIAVTGKELAVAEEMSLIPELTHLDKYLEQHPEKEKVSFVDNYHTASVADALPQDTNIPLTWVLGFGIISLLLVIARLVIPKKESQESISVIEEIELIE